MSSNSIYYEPTAEVSQQGAAQSDEVESEKSDSEPDEATVYKSRVSFSTPRDAGLLDTHLRSESLSFLLMDGMHERIIEVSRCGGELRNFHLRIMWEVGLQNCLCCPLQGKRLLAEEKTLLTFPEERLFRF